MAGRPEDADLDRVRDQWVDVAAYRTMRPADVLAYWLTVATRAPSSQTSALPRARLRGPTRAIARPVNVWRTTPRPGREQSPPAQGIGGGGSPSSRRSAARSALVSSTTATSNGAAGARSPRLPGPSVARTAKARGVAKGTCA